MGDISPVLASFLAGQQGQESLIKTAQGISQQRQAAQQRQQELDDIMKRFDQQHILEQKRVDLESQQHADQHNLQLMNARQQFLENLKSGAQPPQMNDNAIQVPGVPNSPQVPYGLPAVNSPATPKAIQDVDIPGFGKMSVPMPQTDIQHAQAQQEALLPGQVEAERQKSNIDADAYVKKMMPVMQAKLDSQEGIWNQRLDAMRSGFDNRMQIAELGAQTKAMQWLLGNGFQPSAEANNAVVSNALEQAAVGNSAGDFTKDHGAGQGRVIQNAWDSMGFKKLKAGDRDEIMGLGNDATQLLNTIDAFRQSVNQPKNLVGRAKNVLADTFGIGGLSQYKSVYDMLSLDQLPRLEKTLGMTPGALSRSPKLLDKIKGIIPLPGDQEKVVGDKEANAADLFLSAAARRMAGLPAGQRKLLWQDFVHNNTDLVNRNPTLRDKLIGAGNTGTYQAGSLLKDLVQ